MLVVRTVIDESQIAGLGLFAAHPILAGEIILLHGEDDPLIESFSAEEIEALDENSDLRKFFAIYAWKEKGKYWLSLDNDKFTNHSPTPNTVVKEDGNVYAIKDIEPGEEITSDYSQFNELPINFKVNV